MTSRSDDSDNEFGDGDNESCTNSSAYSYMNSFTTKSSSNYSLANHDKRSSRNQNEKKRRDQFNSLIIELGSLLNHARKIDKATVLSETLFFFRNYNGLFLFLFLFLLLLQFKQTLMMIFCSVVFFFRKASV